MGELASPAGGHIGGAVGSTGYPNKGRIVAWPNPVRAPTAGRPTTARYWKALASENPDDDKLKTSQEATPFWGFSSRLIL